MLDLITFTPAQAAKITGINVALQRDWRRRGILPPSEGRTKFTAFAVAEMLALSALAAQAIGPQQFKPIASSLGAGIVASALRDRSAYRGGDIDAVVNTDDEGIVGRLLVARPADRARELWEWRAAWLGRAVLGAAGHNPAAIRTTFIQWAEGSFAFYDGPIQPFEQIDATDPRRSGAIVMLDLEALGVALLKRAGPLVEVGPIAPLFDNQGPRSLMKRVQATLVADMPQNAKGEG